MLYRRERLRRTGCEGEGEEGEEGCYDQQVELRSPHRGGGVGCSSDVDRYDVEIDVIRNSTNRSKYSGYMYSS